MKATSFRSGKASLTCVYVAGAAALFSARAEPFVPSDYAIVLERVAATRDPAERELRDRRARLQSNPGDLGLAADLARHYIRLNRAEGDPRYLGRAQTALASWWDQSRPPVEALVLRAILKQSLHDFRGALDDLDESVRLAPGNAQAWLTRATVLTVLGEYERARPCCLALVRMVPELTVVTASASIAGLTGQAERSCELLQSALDRNTSAPAGEQVWALTVCGENYTRLGRVAEAERCFQRALGFGERDVYLLGALGDLLLDTGRPREARDLLQREERVDALLLRLALAERALSRRPSCLDAHVRTLRDQFAGARLRGDSVHRREEARFMLHLLHEPAAALELAKANWEVQREPADVRILLEAALAAHNPVAAIAAVQFVQKSGLEDVRIRQLCEECKRQEVQ
jgi:tetratricopeptide (TPR) repeat protein